MDVFLTCTAKGGATTYSYRPLQFFGAFIGNTVVVHDQVPAVFRFNEIVFPLMLGVPLRVQVIAPEPSAEENFASTKEQRVLDAARLISSGVVMFAAKPSRASVAVFVLPRLISAKAEVV